MFCRELTLYFKHLISTRQHGFTKGRSTVTNLSEFTNKTIEVMESGNQIDVVYTDFSKAFDKICHKVLLKNFFNITPLFDARPNHICMIVCTILGFSILI